MEKNKELRIVRGNDFIINMPVKNIVFLRDELGYTTKGVLPTDFANCKDIEVNLADGCGWYKPVEFVVKDDLLQIKIDGNIECGWYGVELRYVYEDVKYRSYERKVFKIVESNGGSYATPDVYEGELGYHIDAMWSLACVVDEVYLRSLVGTKSYERGSGENSAQQIGTGAQALGVASHAEGGETEASGDYAHAEGYNTHATNAKAHAEGDLCVASGDSSHAEGDETIASGKQAHAECHLTQAVGSSSHAEGKKTIAYGKHSHAEGEETIAGGQYEEGGTYGDNSHAEGYGVRAVGEGSHAEGYKTIAGGLYDEDGLTYMYGYYSHAEGDSTEAAGDASHAEGKSTVANGDYSHAEGHHTITSNKGEHACGRYNVSNTGNNDADKTMFSVGIGNNTRKNGLEVRENGDVYMWVGGEYTNINPYIAYIGELDEIKQEQLHSGSNIKTIWGKEILGSGDLIEGDGCTADGLNAHAEGKSTVASGDYSHAEGDSTQALAISSHTEGCQTKTESVSNNGVKVYYAHAEGNGTIAAGSNSHTEGYQTKTYANNSHAEGHSSEAHGDGSHAEGYGTIAYNLGEHACGRYNESTETKAATDTEEAVAGTVFSVGIGVGKLNRKNAIDIREDGRIYIWLNGEYVCLQDLLTSTPNQSPLPPQYGVINEVGEKELNNIVDDYLDKEEE